MKNAIAKMRGRLFRLRLKYSRKNISVGEGLLLFCPLEIKGTGRVTIGRDCVVSRTPGNKVRHVTIYTNSPDAQVTIGDRVRLTAVGMSSKFEITIGDDVLIEESGLMDTDFHAITADRGEPNESRDACRVRVGDRVSIGARSIICKGLTIGDDALVFPGSVVNKSVPAGSVVAGNPVRPFRPSSPKAQAEGE
jgi:acetyltransferase-like isoleucine patch superfamily enzyme